MLVPLSFSYIEYNQYALKRNTFGSTVDVDHIYDNGRYAWGLNYEPVDFPRQYQKVVEGFDVFPDSGLEFRINIVFYYRLQKSNIGKLFKAFGTVFHNHVISRANAKIKNQAPNFSVKQYTTDRPIITQQLHSSLVGELNSIWIDVPFDKFYLTEISIPPAILEKDLDASVQKQRNIEEQNHQLEIVVRKETEQLVQEINANITLIKATAEATAIRIEKEAKAIAEKTLASADGLGLEDMFSQLNVTDPELKQKYFTYFAFLDSLK